MKQNQFFTNGITNGAEVRLPHSSLLPRSGCISNNAHQWYVLYGGMQDWNYVARGTFEVTVELSSTLIRVVFPKS